MTVQHNLSESLRFNDIIEGYQEILSRQVNAALDKKEMDKDAYIYFISQECTVDSIDDVYDHFEHIFNELAAYHLDRIQKRIIKGAEMLDGMSKSDPRYSQYLKLYDSLIERIKQNE